MRGFIRLGCNPPPPHLIPEMRSMLYKPGLGVMASSQQFVFIVRHPTDLGNPHHGHVLPLDRRFLWNELEWPDSGTVAQGTPAPGTLAPGTPAPGTPAPMSSLEPTPVPHSSAGGRLSSICGQRLITLGMQVSYRDRIASVACFQHTRLSLLWHQRRYPILSWFSVHVCDWIGSRDA